MGRRFSTGFTLVDSLMVVFLLGIIATLALPILHGAVDGSQLSGAAAEVVTALEFAQMTAMTTGTDTRVTIDAGAETILVERFTPDEDLLGSETELDEEDVEDASFTTMGHPLNRGTDYNINLADQGLYGSVVDIASAAFGPDNFVTFNSLGAPSACGTVTLFLGSIGIVVTVDSLTGKVTLS
jgi:Tfp pilus assembly protein FimT